MESKPKLLMDIHKVSEVNNPNIHLSEIDGPAHAKDFEIGSNSTGDNSDSEACGIMPKEDKNRQVIKILSHATCY